MTARMRRFARHIGIATLAVALSVGVIGPVAAEGPSRSELVELLQTRYAERPVALGLANNGGVIEVLTSPDGATWTILLTMPDGSSYIMVTGESWLRLTELKGETS